MPMQAQDTAPSLQCALCPRLANMRGHNRTRLPGGWHAPVPSFGDLSAPLLIVGLAPGLRGANYTGRPFTGDGAGEALYPALLHASLAHGVYGAASDDGLRLIGCRITNAVRCVPPDNKPTSTEIKTCNAFLCAEIAAMAHLRTILVLGRIAHYASLSALGARGAQYPFFHGAEHKIGDIVVLSSYHCSRYNMNTGRLTQSALEVIVKRAAVLRS